jgi:hypothetical protein
MKGREHLDGRRRRLDSVTETVYECLKYCFYGTKDECLSAKILDIVEEGTWGEPERDARIKILLDVAGLKTQLLQPQKKEWVN